VEEAVAFLRDLCASVVKMPFGLSVPSSADTGSFDCVRLAPHFAQDDRFLDDRFFEERHVLKNDHSRERL
jgi:hypothetical protein